MVHALLHEHVKTAIVTFILWQCSAVQYRAVPSRTAQHSIMQHSAAQHSTGYFTVSLYRFLSSAGVTQHPTGEPMVAYQVHYHHQNCILHQGSSHDQRYTCILYVPMLMNRFTDGYVRILLLPSGREMVKCDFSIAEPITNTSLLVEMDPSNRVVVSTPQASSIRDIAR